MTLAILRGSLEVAYLPELHVPKPPTVGERCPRRGYLWHRLCVSSNFVRHLVGHHVIVFRVQAALQLQPKRRGEQQP